MNQIKAKVYYEVLNSNVLIITSEMQTDIEETTKVEDMKRYEQLKDRNIDEVDFIELEYGTLASTFNNAKSYKMNVETKKLEVTYYTKEELEAIKIQNQETENLNARVTDISQYLTEQNNQSISDIEDYILQSEQNKIINGGM